MQAMEEEYLHNMVPIFKHAKSSSVKIPTEK